MTYSPAQIQTRKFYFEELVHAFFMHHGHYPDMPDMRRMFARATVKTVGIPPQSWLLFGMYRAPKGGVATMCGGIVA